MPERKTAQPRYRNRLPVRTIIEEFLIGKESASFKEIYAYVSPRVTLKSKTPRSSVFSIVHRMPNVVRVDRGRYRLRVKPKG